MLEKLGTEKSWRSLLKFLGILRLGINIFRKHEIGVWQYGIIEILNMLKPLKFENQETNKLWNKETLKPRNQETKKPNNQETKKLRNQETKKPRNQDSFLIFI